MQEIIYTDGGAKNNPGPAALGVYFVNLNKKYSQFLGEKTNNEAEYLAVIFALKKLKKLIGRKKAKETIVEIRSDSLLVCSHFNRLYKIKEKKLFPLFIEVWNLCLDFKKVNFKYIKREENKIADSLVKKELVKNQSQLCFGSQ